MAPDKAERERLAGYARAARKAAAVEAVVCVQRLGQH
jgi:hypothetical protein